MKYTKTSLSFTEQADLLLKRGLIANRNLIVDRLKAVNYYRLSAYWYTFRDPNGFDDKLLPNTSLKTVWRRYVFDRHLRFLVMDGIERVEIALRTQITNHFCLQYGPFGYLNRDNLPGLSVADHHKLLTKLGQEADASHEDFVRHYFKKYSSETDMPLWMACELMTFGTTFTLYRGLKSRMKKDIAKEYGIHAPVLSSWLRSLNQVRNICAHHARLWNREFGVKPLIPESKTFPEWHTPIRICNNKAFGILTVLYFLLKQAAPQSKWRNRLVNLFTEYNDVPKHFMGFPSDWAQSPIWENNLGEV